MNVMKRLTLKDLSRNRVRTIMTIFGIMLSTALITVVTGMAECAKQSYINSEIISNGDWTVGIKGQFDEDTAKSLAERGDVYGVYEKTPVGVARFDSKSAYKPYVQLTGLSPNTYGECCKSELEKGRFPESDDEILLTPQFCHFSEKTYDVGDTITLGVGSRWQKGKVTKASIPKRDTQAYNEYHLPDDFDYSATDEELVEEFTKTYTVTGILKNTDGGLQPNYSSGAVALYTGANYGGGRAVSCADTSEIDIRLTDPAEGRYIEFLAELTGKSPETVKNELNYGTGDENGDEAAQSNEYKITDFRSNYRVLRAKGIGVSDSTADLLFRLAVVLVAVIVLSSVFIIRNSFAISITEKTRLYGMLRSVGASSRQIRRGVMFEGFMLGIVGIPLGVALGIGVTALLTLLCNALLGDALGGMRFVFTVSVIGVPAAVVLSALTVFISVFFIAKRAAGISPIEAIRGSRDIKSEENENCTVPKWIDRRFGAGGMIAYKNLRRSRKKYRTTVISVVLSVTLFLTMYSFIGYAFTLSGQYTSHTDYNISVDCLGYMTGGELTDAFDTIRVAEGVEEAADVVHFAGFESIVDKDAFTEEAQQSGAYSAISGDPSKMACSPWITAVNDEIYREILKNKNLDYDVVKDKGLIVNSFISQDGEKDLFRHAAGTKLSLLSSSECEYDENADLVVKPGYERYIKAVLEIAGELEPEDIPEKYRNLTVFDGGTVLVSREWMKKNLADEQAGGKAMLMSSNADLTEQEISELFAGKLSLSNAEKEAQNMNALSLLVQIFVYGFIIVISLIGMTNIFNTVTTNMRLRSREFAMLRSVGMTRREFNRMIMLESILYSSRALVIGIPLGILGGLGVKLIFDQKFHMDYQFPWLGILIAAAAAALMIWIIMRYSVRKAQRQNIIETIRDENT